MLKDMQECKARRKKLRITLCEAARALNINNNTLSAFEKVNAAPDAVFDKYREYLENYNPNDTVIYASEAETNYVPVQWAKDLWIFLLMQKLKLTNVAVDLNMSYDVLRNILTGRTRMNHFDFEKIAHYLINSLQEQVLGGNFREDFKYPFRTK